MEREDWVKSLSQGDRGIINFAFRYYKEKGGTVSPQDFSRILLPFLNIEYFVSDMNAKFEITTLYTKEGKLIKIV